MNPLLMYLNSAMTFVPVIQLFGRCWVRVSGNLYEHFVDVSELGDDVGACHSAFRLVTGTGATRWHLRTNTFRKVLHTIYNVF